ncbi:hypothetical protein Q8F55_002258 [Vanrija albida]|uniref:sn-1-specific diacylglycerol lipase n=1 Tax=Vanrija albida TaxID=181172 RepID=A0ABR3Q9W9_9TREE
MTTVVSTRPAVAAAAAATTTAQADDDDGANNLQVTLRPAAGPLTLALSAETVFPAPIANLVTALATSARLSLRVTAFFIEAILESSQYGTRVSLGYTRRLLISAISSARRVYLASNAALDNDLMGYMGFSSDKSAGTTDAFLNVLDRWTNLGIYVIHHTFTLAELFAMSGFYLTANTVQGASFAAHESVTLFDSLFGSNESSRALSSIITLVRKELLDDDRFKAADRGRVASLTALTKALTAFACLQSATWGRSSQRLKFRVLYDCTITISDDESFSANTEGPTTITEELAIEDAPGPSTISGRRRREELPAIEVSVDEEDAEMASASREATPSRTLGPTPESNANADLELLRQLEHLVGESADDAVFDDNTRRRTSRLKRLREDTFEITDEVSESTVVTQTFERLSTATAPSSPRSSRFSGTGTIRGRTASIAPNDDVLIETLELDDNAMAVDDDERVTDASASTTPRTPTSALPRSNSILPLSDIVPTVVEADETEWIEVDHLLDDGTRDDTLPSAPNGVPPSSPVASIHQPDHQNTEKIQLVLRTMTNKLLQRKRVVRRVQQSRMSASPSPPPSRGQRSGGPSRDEANRPDVRAIQWEVPTRPAPPPPRQATPPKERRGSSSAGTSGGRSSPKPSPSPKGKGRIFPRRSMLGLRDERSESSSNEAGPSRPRRDGSTRNRDAGSSAFGSVRSAFSHSKHAPPVPFPGASEVKKEPPMRVAPNSPPGARVPRVPPPTPYAPPQRLPRTTSTTTVQESLRTRANRVRTESAQMFTPSAPTVDTATNLFPHEPLIKNIHRFMRYSSAAYGQNFLRIFGLGNADFNFPTTGRHHANSWAFAQHTNIPIDSLLLSSYSESSPAFSSAKAPPLVHYIAVEHKLKAIVLTCRGTLGLSDVLVDLTCDYREIPVDGGDPNASYLVHSGMYDSALQLTAKRSTVHQTLVDALNKYPNYGLVLCGHSLGGGVAGLLAITCSVKRERFIEQNAARAVPVKHPRITTPFVTSFGSGLPPGRPIHCYAYGIPAVASADLASYSAGLITSVVQNSDVVPTLSLGVLRDLKNIAVTLFEEGNIAEEIVSRVIGINRSKFAFQSGGEPSTSTELIDTVSDEQVLSDWMMSLIKTMRADMDNDKLYPPGMVYVMEYFDVFVTVDAEDRLSGDKATSSKRAQRVILRQCDSVEERFREPLFSKTMLNDHLPSHYERSTQLLYDGLGQGLL